MIKFTDRTAPFWIALILLYSLVLPIHACAQDSSPFTQPPVPPQRPRIGLALSGGGHWDWQRSA